MEYDKLTIRGLRARAVNVPMQRPILTRGGQVDTFPLVLVDLTTEEGITGSGYIFGYTPLTLRSMVCFLKEIEELIKGDPVRGAA